MDQRLHNDNAIIGVGHRGIYGEVHYFDKIDRYGAKATIHTEKDSYSLSIPSYTTDVIGNNHEPAVGFEDLNGKWAALVDDFLERHPECDRFTQTITWQDEE